LSGGVDSTVAAVLVHRAMGERLTNIFVNTGLLRKNEFEHTLEIVPRRLGLRVIGVDASGTFSGEAGGRKRSGAEAQDYRARVHHDFCCGSGKLQKGAAGDIKFLVQGTLYPDVIESVSVKGPSATIKTHHNVGGLPENMPFRAGGAAAGSYLRMRCGGLEKT